MNVNTHAISHRAWHVLKYTYGIVIVIVGLDKFFDFVVRWSQYVSPIVAKMLPVSMHHFMYGVGIVEIIVGILILTKWTRLGAYLAAAWLIIISINLVSMGIYYDIAVRDMVMAAGAYALAELSRIHER